MAPGKPDGSSVGIPADRSVHVTDVIVLGAGPGGCAAAIGCRTAGLRVVLLEAQPFPRQRPGETLHPGIEPLLHQLGVGDRILQADFLRHTGHWVQWNSTPQFMPFGADARGTWQGFQAERARLDALLLDRCRELGVTVLQPCRATRLIVENDRVVGVQTPQGKLYSTQVIDASGGQHWLARQQGLDIRFASPRLIAHYGYVTGTCPARDEAPAIVADAAGWSWTARVGAGLYQWTRLNLNEPFLVKNWLPSEFQTLRPIGPTRAADVTWRCVSRPAGAGYFLVGDAALVLDPASSHGVLKAVMSGILAANLTVKLRQGCPEQAAIDHYQQWLSNWFEHDTAQLREMYAQLPHPPAWIDRAMAANLG